MKFIEISTPSAQIKGLTGSWFKRHILPEHSALNPFGACWLTACQRRNAVKGCGRAQAGRCQRLAVSRPSPSAPCLVQTLAVQHHERDARIVALDAGLLPRQVNITCGQWLGHGIGLLPSMLAHWHCVQRSETAHRQGQNEEGIFVNSHARCHQMKYCPCEMKYSSTELKIKLITNNAHSSAGDLTCLKNINKHSTGM